MSVANSSRSKLVFAAKWEKAERELPPDPGHGVEHFPVRLLHARVARRISQKALAGQVGVALPTLIAWEHGRSRPDFVQLERLAQLLLVSVAQLAGWSDPGNWMNSAEASDRGWLACPRCLPSLGQIYVPQYRRGDWPIGHTTVVETGLYVAIFNQHGAASVRATNGELLGLKPGEFHWTRPVPPYDRWCNGAGGLHR